MKRKRLNDNGNSLVRPRLRKPVPDRTNPTQLIVGPKSAFTTSQLSGLEEINLDKLYEHAWIVIFSGPSYTDLDRAITKSSAEACVKHFLTCYPKLKVTWLEVKRKEVKHGKSFDKTKWLKASKGRKASRV